MGELDSTRNTYILERGAYDAHGEKVEPGLPASILPFPDSLPKNRLGLAKWLFDKENPLPARVFVNRIWQDLFGPDPRKIAKRAVCDGGCYDLD